MDTSLVGWGPEAYDRVDRAYDNPIVRLLELGLVAAVLYHSLNGLKITLIDFFPRLVPHIKVIGGPRPPASFLLVMIPVTWIMLDQTLDLLFDRVRVMTTTTERPRARPPRALRASPRSGATVPPEASSSGCGSSCGSAGSC